MGAAIKAEIRKLLTTRLWWGMAIGIIVLGAGIAALVAGFGGNTGESPDGSGSGGGQSALERASGVYTAGIGVGYLLLLVIGILTIGMEYRHKTITSALLATPSRVRLIGAKIVALLIFGVFYGVVFLVASVGAGGAILAVKGEQVFPEPATLGRTLLLSLLVLGLWALIGLGLGILIPNQVAALLIGVGLAFIVEPIAGAILSTQSWGQTVSNYFPSRATGAILDQTQAANGPDVAELLTWWQGSLVLLAYAVVFAGIGMILTQRRDIL